MSAERVLVPIAPTATARRTVGAVVDEGLADGNSLELHLVTAVSSIDETTTLERRSPQELLETAAAWAKEDAGEDRLDRLQLETRILGTDDYLFGPRDFAELFAAEMETYEIDRLVLDPEYDPGAGAPMIQPMEYRLMELGVRFEEATVGKIARRSGLTSPASFGRIATLYLISLGFYFLLGDITYWFDWVTGIVVATIVALTFSHVTYAIPPTLRESPIRTIRFGLYIPYLLWEIIKANVIIAIVILRPSMPIDPQLVRMHARVRGGLPTLALANSITLTPGTLTVEANDNRLLVHTLVPQAMDDLLDGGLERAVRYVFMGKVGRDLPSPRERGDYTLLGGDAE